jgi:predicted enzyme related to lactoylglutathione lyase
MILQMSPQFLVKNLERSIEFYTKQLNFTLDFCYEEFYAGVSKDGYSIHLKLGNSSTEERTRKRNNQDLDVVLTVDHIKKLFQELSNRSINVLQPLRTMPYGKEFYIEDPDGYIISFLEMA